MINICRGGKQAGGIGVSGSTVENDKAVAKVKHYDDNGKQIQPSELQIYVSYVSRLLLPCSRIKHRQIYAKENINETFSASPFKPVWNLSNKLDTNDVQ